MRDDSHRSGPVRSGMRGSVPVPAPKMPIKLCRANATRMTNVHLFTTPTPIPPPHPPLREPPFLSLWPIIAVLIMNLCIHTYVYNIYVYIYYI